MPCSLADISKPPYELKETGWGEFDVSLKVFFLDKVEAEVCRKLSSSVECAARNRRNGRLSSYPAACLYVVELCSGDCFQSIRFGATPLLLVGARFFLVVI